MKVYMYSQFLFFSEYMVSGSKRVTIINERGTEKRKRREEGVLI